MMSLESALSTAIVLSALLFTLAVMNTSTLNLIRECSRHALQTKLLTASEVLMTSSDKGLAEYSGNKVKHHVISPEKLEYLKSLPAEQLGDRLGLKRAWIKPVNRKACVRRIGVLNGVPAVITLCGE